MGLGGRLDGWVVGCWMAAWMGKGGRVGGGGVQSPWCSVYSTAIFRRVAFPYSLQLQ